MEKQAREVIARVGSEEDGGKGRNWLRRVARASPQKPQHSSRVPGTVSGPRLRKDPPEVLKKYFCRFAPRVRHQPEKNRATVIAAVDVGMSASIGAATSGHTPIQ